VARPTGVRAGDLLLAAIELRQASGRGTSAPAGWRLIRRDRARRGHASLTQALYSKLAGDQEPSRYEWRFERAAPALRAIVAHRGGRPAPSWSASSGTGTSATTRPTGLKERLDRRGGSERRPLQLEAADSLGAVRAKGPRIAKLGRGEALAVGQLVALRRAPATTPPPPGRPCAGTKAPSRYDHVVWIVFENHSYNQVIGSSSAPYFNRLAGRCGLATNFSAITHPSLPNYIALTSGSTHGITDDGSPSEHPLNVPSIFSQLPSGGSRSLQESMPSNCALKGSGRYAVRHNPQAYYTSVRGDCARYNVPLGKPANISARFTFVTPNLCSDTHDCSVSTGDSWLVAFLPPLLASSEYRAGKTAIFVTFDEGSGNNHIVTIVVAPPVHAGARSATAYTHYSLLRTTEEMLGLGRIGNAQSATSMRAGFGL
jgi:hypothetical protein